MTLTDEVHGAIVRADDFVFYPLDWGRIAEPVGPQMGARKVTLLVIEVAPEKVWRLGWALEEENVAVVHAGSGTGDVTGHRAELARGSALYSPTGRTLELAAGSEGMTAYVWRTRLEGGEPVGTSPRLTSALGNDEHQLNGFLGTGERSADETPALVNLVFWPGTGSARLCLHCGIHDPGKTFNIHQHPQSEEAFFAFEGEGQVYLVDSWHDFKAGDVFFAAAGVLHGTRNPSPTGERFAVCGGPTPFDATLYARGGVSSQVV
nr:cupin domain-containing protein [Kibdelosporangium sp. MJ126-NF4]CTQ90391.1 hypothetical protein [Kibdelosporangium sp. MJ126-NF4]